MIADRWFASATLLANGTVLVAGGWQDAEQSVLGTAELYDPDLGVFTATGSMAQARQAAAATLLNDGRVLITGCGGDAFAELYSPYTGKFETEGSMVARRCDHTATRLADGRVLVAGGGNDSGFLSSAELYDPATGLFKPTGSMRTRRENATATLLPDGRVLIVGGDQGDTADNQVILKSAELYDPATGSFSSTGSMNVARSHFTATLLLDGRVLIAGGDNSGLTPTNMWASAELYDPSTGKFGPTGSMSEPRADHTATLLIDGRVLIADSPDGSADLYDPTMAVFAPTGPMPGTAGGPAVRLVNGSVLFPGDPSALYWP
jgi:hypothetical protein